jgi:hypothetical protein
MSNTPIPYAVGQMRHSALDSLDFFPTPPWATRALIEWIAANVYCDLAQCTCWEPAAGGRHMANVLAEAFRLVVATDVHDYGDLDDVGSFVGEGLDVIQRPRSLDWPKGRVDWVVTNPPFKLSEAFVERALGLAACGVAMLLRSAWVDGIGRYNRIFARTPPSAVLQFAERVPMVRGRWDPGASTATPYAWFVWYGPHREVRDHTRLYWIKPGAAQRCTRPNDVARFAGEKAHA